MVTRLIVLALRKTPLNTVFRVIIIVRKLRAFFTFPLTAVVTPLSGTLEKRLVFTDIITKVRKVRTCVPTIKNSSSKIDFIVAKISANAAIIHPFPPTILTASVIIFLSGRLTLIISILALLVFGLRSALNRAINTRAPKKRFPCVPRWSLTMLKLFPRQTKERPGPFLCSKL